MWRWQLRRPQPGVRGRLTGALFPQPHSQLFGPQAIRHEKNRTSPANDKMPCLPGFSRAGGPQPPTPQGLTSRGSPGADPQSPPVRANPEPPGSHAPPHRPGSPPRRSSPWPGSGSADTPLPPPGPPQVGGGTRQGEAFCPSPTVESHLTQAPIQAVLSSLLPHWKGGHIPHLLTLGWGGDSISNSRHKAGPPETCPSLLNYYPRLSRAEGSVFPSLRGVMPVSG